MEKKIITVFVGEALSVEVTRLTVIALRWAVRRSGLIKRVQQPYKSSPNMAARGPIRKGTYLCKIGGAQRYLYPQYTEILIHSTS